LTESCQCLCTFFVRHIVIPVERLSILTGIVFLGWDKFYKSLTND
jgi:hypothetical protein